MNKKWKIQIAAIKTPKDRGKKKKDPRSKNNTQRKRKRSPVQIIPSGMTTTQHCSQLIRACIFYKPLNELRQSPACHSYWNSRHKLAMFFYRVRHIVEQIPSYFLPNGCSAGPAGLHVKRQSPRTARRSSLHDAQDQQQEHVNWC